MKVAFLPLVLGVVCVAAVGCSQDQPAAAYRDKDNTGVNVRDREGSTTTPVDQSQNQADLDVTAQIRKEIVAEKDVSVSARNVKIVTQETTVTLRGPVASEAEKELIDKIARRNAGERKVENLLEVLASN